MGLSNKVIFFSGYKKLKKFQVDTDIGKFNCTLLKEKCMNKFYIKAEQISVIYMGKEHIANIDCNRLRLPVTFLPNYMKLSVVTKEFELKNLEYCFYMEPHMFLKNSYLKFKKELKDKIKPYRY